ncbi:helix-turn-helix domain-containing protein [Maritalea mediterranea]|uniref:Helix-turn-helix domain-containing protein n=1 Tax=Maritalea mediterranea TaxID=2909667 RepID=A0ABS9ECA9_9HYPH|nr:helix-turn-helix domain-containing protein [Maritalea mediterranea]MCF4099509.1 helix-turn-helix domain-containing protein [Maritalea mediterranea]
MPTAKANAPKKVAILAYDRLCTFEYGIAVEMFDTIQSPTAPLYKAETVAIESGDLRLAGGLRVPCTVQLDRLKDFDLIIVPGWPPDKKVNDEVAAALRAALFKGARFMCICSGTFLLLRAGLTRNKTITTHWQYLDLLKAEATNEQVAENVLYCGDAQIMSSAGSAAGLDLGLEIVRQELGAAEANRMAQRLVLPAHREGGQKQFVPRPLAQPQKGSLAKYLDQVRQQLDQPWPVKKLAAFCHLSERTLMRRFQEIMGVSPNQWLTRERVAFARSLLEKEHFTMDEIAERAGFNTPETMRHHFRTQLKISPARYRENFRQK